MSEKKVQKNLVSYLQLGLAGVLLVLAVLEIRAVYFDKTGSAFNEEASAPSYEYRIGDALSFAEEATANPYCVYGFSANEGTHTWTSGYIAKMAFDLEGEQENLFLDFSCNPYVSPQRVFVYANGNEIASLTVEGPGSQRVPLPAEVIADRRLSLDFVLPDAVSPKARGESEDGRLLALGMLDICISGDAQET